MRALTLVALLLAAPLPATAQRVVSLNLCTDQYLLALAPQKATAVTFLARDPELSAMATAAATVPTVRADAEAVLALHPDLVLAGRWGARATLDALARRGVAIERIDPPADFPAIRATTLALGARLGATARAAALLAEMDATLAALPPPTHQPAIALEPRGYSAGPGSLRAAVLDAAGLENAGDGSQLSLEALAARPAVLLVLAPPPPFPSRATEFLSHPLLAHHRRRTVPAALTICGGPWTARAVAQLAR
ncbi:MAG: ABC transporter substrate-binding protein [Acetobacteraceae bacterium]|nr:ABC transporter substrate-binding protein [Acetobacteraceae bacterium]